MIHTPGARTWWPSPRPSGSRVRRSRMSRCEEGFRCFPHHKEHRYPVGSRRVSLYTSDPTFRCTARDCEQGCVFIGSEGLAQAGEWSLQAIECGHLPSRLPQIREMMRTQAFIQAQEGRFVVLLSLQEAESFRGCLHMAGRTQGLVGETRSAAAIRLTDGTCIDMSRG